MRQLPYLLQQAVPRLAMRPLRTFVGHRRYGGPGTLVEAATAVGRLSGVIDVKCLYLILGEVGRKLETRYFVPVL